MEADTRGSKYGSVHEEVADEDGESLSAACEASYELEHGVGGLVQVDAFPADVY